jgi:hypothetical protein
MVGRNCKCEAATQQPPVAAIFGAVGEPAHAIVRLAGERFESFALQPTAGYYKGESEESIMIEVVGAEERAVKALASAVRKMNGQKSVLVLKLRGAAAVVRNN